MLRKKVFILIGCLVILFFICVGIGIIFVNNSFKEKSDAEKFSEIYIKVPKNNVYVLKTSDEIIKILKNGTGIVFLGFPECDWCQAYTPYLNDVAMDMAVSKIYYYNIQNDRQNNTEVYSEIVDILSDYLQYDNEGNKRIYVPAVVAIKKGKIVGYDDETAWDTHGYENPNDYWTDLEIKDLKEKLETMISDTEINICDEQCN